MGFYSFLKRGTAALGAGVDDQALMPVTPPLTPLFGAGRAIARPLVRFHGAGVKTAQHVVPVSGLGTSGLGFHGGFDLVPLAKDGSK